MYKTKRIKVSPKRQVTIPQKFFDALNIQEEVECTIRGGELIIRPYKQESEFSEEILTDLIKEGLSGDELLYKFREVRSKVRPAIEAMMEEGDKLAQKEQGTGDDTIKEIFLDQEDK